MLQIPRACHALWYNKGMSRKSYASDVSDDEWAFVVSYLTLMRENAPQREHSLREVFNGLRWIIRTGAQWRMLPNDRPPWYTVQQQTQRWLAAGVFEQMVDDLRRIVRLAEGREAEPRALSQKADCFGKEADCVWELEKLGGDLKQAIDQRDLGEHVALFRSFHLPFSDHMHRLVACQCAPRCLEGKETGSVAKTVVAG